MKDDKVIEKRNSKPRIAQIRASRGITLEVLAEVTGLSVTTLHKIDRNGINKASFINGLIVCRALGITPEEAIDDLSKLI